MSAKKSCVAVVGLGAVAEPHLTAYQAIDGVEVCGVVEPRKDRLSDICSRYGVQGFSTIDALLEHTKPHVACVLSPVNTHRATTEKLAAGGVHVLCEKPIAISTADAIAMRKTCSKHGIDLFYGSSYRYLPAVQRARDLIKSGVVGDIRMVLETVIGGQGAEAFVPMSSSHYPENGPGGGPMGLVDHGIHLLDIIPWLCNSPISAALGRGDLTGKPARPEFALFTTRSGVLGILVYDGSTWSASSPASGAFSESRKWIDGRGWMGNRGMWDPEPGTIQIFGTVGSLRVLHYANKLVVTRQGESHEEPLPHIAAPDHFGLQLQDFLGSIARGEKPSIGADDGIRTLQVLEAVYLSNKTGAWQPVPTTP